ncbi:MAG: amidohydrolase family protein, partial [Gammaproteobacteria bacterium]
SSGRLSPLSTVVVMHDRITQVIAGDEPAPASDRQVVIDGEGGTLVPGLHDMHSHSSLQSGLFYLAAGVTATRDMGNVNDFLLDLMPRIEAGEIAGPRITPAGFIEGRSDYSARTGIIPETLDEALATVHWYADRGYRQIKVYNSMNPDWVQPMAAEAHRLGLTVTGHIPAFATPDEMIRAGYDEIAHINQLMLGWLLDEGEDTRTPLRLTAMARAANLDLSSSTVQETVALMKARGIKHDPTAVILERLMLSRAGTVAPGDADYLDHMPIGYRRYRKRSFVDIDTPAVDRQYREAFAKILDTLKLLHDNGIQLLPGTDDGTGFTVHRELELYTHAGLSPAEALRLGTLAAEEYFGRSDRLGSIERGKLADFFLIAGDPTEDIRAIKRPRMVLKGGAVYFPDEIYTALRIEPFTAPPPITGAAVN